MKRKCLLYRNLQDHITNVKASSFYEGGKITKANQDFYNASQPFEETASPDRDTLRARARWLSENNPIMGNIDNSIKNNTLGAPIKLQYKSENTALNEEIEQKWSEAKEELDITGTEHFDEYCKIILGNRFVDGEVPIYMPTQKVGFGKVALRLQAIECDRFLLGNNKTKRDGFLYDGVETDKFGRVINYHFVDDIYSNSVLLGKKEGDVILKAADVLYYYKKENRFTQYRGISEYKRCILDLKNFSAQMTSTIQAARARSNVAYAIENSTGQAPYSLKNDQDEYIREINGVLVKFLKRGDKITKLDPDVAGDNFSDFVEKVVRLIANGRSISYELAFRDYSQVNYSSARASMIQDNLRFDHEFEHFTKYVYNRVFLRWLEIEVLQGNIRNLSATQFYKKPYEIKKAIKVYKAKRDWVDPQKDTKATVTLLENNLLSHSEIYAQKGQDFEEQVKIMKRDKELLAANGLMEINTI